jgi:hypothetical protein
MQFSKTSATSGIASAEVTVGDFEIFFGGFCVFVTILFLPH